MSQFSVPWQDEPKRFGPLGRAVAGLARSLYLIFAPIVRRIPLIILLAALVATIIGVWFIAEVFRYVDVHVLAPAAQAGEASTLSVATFETYMRAEGAPAVPAIGLAKYLLWVLQFRIVRDLTVLAGLFGLFNVVPAFVIWWERKVAGRIQSRVGPMRVGGWHGWAQSAADGIKLVLKEDLAPEGADKPLFRMAPYLNIMPALTAFAALPFGVMWVFRELDVSLLFILAMLGIEVMGVIVAGWASCNKWSLYGAMREACQMVSYEIPMGMALLVPVIAVGSLSLHQIGLSQQGGWFSWLAFANPFAFVAFVTYYIASLASCKRAPFDLPEAESELVAGFLTEYSGFRWALFFFAEYAAMFVVAALAAILFLGGWNSPLPVAWGAGFDTVLGSAMLARAAKGLLFAGPVWLLLKCAFLMYTQIWVRWTLPRLRIDQMLYACVQVLLPLTMVLVLGAALWAWADMSDSDVWAWVGRVVTWVLGLVGLVFVIGFVAIAGYGFANRRRLVGYLAVDPLPGG